MEIINSFARTSEPFVIGKGEQYTFFASGLSGADEVVIEVLTVTGAGPGGDFCCPGPVALPEVVGAIPLICRNGVQVKMTAELPWLILSSPQSVPLRARVVTSDDSAVITVVKNVSDSEDCLGCACEEPPPKFVPAPICASVPLPGGGYMFHPGDSRDPAATVPLEACPGGVLGFVFSAAGPGHTVEVRDCNNALIGWAVNRSECAPEISYTAGCSSAACNGGNGGNGGSNQPNLNPGICPSMRLPGGGYVYANGDLRDPAATVPLETCPGVTFAYAYPSAGPGHTIALWSCDNKLIGYAANRSACAPECTLCDVAESMGDDCGGGGVFDECGSSSGASGSTEPIVPVPVSPPTPEPAPQTVADLVTTADQSFFVISPKLGPSVGASGTITAKLKNNGPAAANGAKLQMSLPAGLQATSVALTYTGGATGPATIVASSNMVVTTTAAPLGAEVTATVQCTAVAEGSWSVTASAIAPSGVSDQAANSLSSTVVTVS